MMTKHRQLSLEVGSEKIVELTLLPDSTLHESGERFASEVC